MSLTESEYLNNSINSQLAPDHLRALTEGSAIADDLLVGVATIEHGRELPSGFSRRQRGRGRGMLFKGHRPNRQTFWTYRPDEPDPDNPGLKYEAMPKRRPGRKQGGPGNVLYVHPSQRHLIKNLSVPVVYIEGIKKALSHISATRAAGVEVLVVAISGTWNWMSDGKPIPDMYEIPVEGRRVDIDFDSDVLRNPGVQGACDRLAEHLTKRGAEVWISYLHDQADGSKMGDDDFFADGGTYAELQMLKRPYDPDDFARLRLNRFGTIRALVEDLRRRWGALPASTPKECSLRDVYLVYVEEAERSGVPTKDGIGVRMSQGTGRIRAKVSPRTFWRCQVRLEEMGLGYRDNRDRKPGESGRFVLRAQVCKGGGKRTQAGVEGPDFEACHPPCIPPRAPRLMWSKPKWKPSKKAISEHRRGLRAWLGEPREGIPRLGKTRGAVVDFLDLAGGSANLQEIADFLDRKRPRDLVRRKTTDKGRDGLLVWLIDAEIVEVDRDLVTLAPEWLEALKAERRAAGEIEAEKEVRRELRRKRDDFRAHRRRSVEKPSPVSVAAVRHSHELREAEMLKQARPISEIEHAPKPEPEIVAALAVALRCWPDHADDYPSWWASTLYYDDYLPYKPTPTAVEVALYELRREAA